MPRVLLTGATGFLGQHLLRQLVDRGVTVAALHRRPESAAELRALGAVPVPGDVTDPASLDAALREPTDAVFHSAADTSVWKRGDAAQTRTNVEGAANVVAAVRARGVKRLVHTSSVAAFGHVDDQALVETLPRAGVDSWINYERTKALAENLVREAVQRSEIDAVILNPAHIMGPGDRHNWTRLILLLDQNKLPGAPPGSGAFADVRQVAAAHLAAWQTGRSGESYLLGGDYVSFLDLLRKLAARIGCAPPKRALPKGFLHFYSKCLELMADVTGKPPRLTPEGAALTSQHLRVDSAKAMAELGYAPTPLDDLVRDTVDWLRAEHLLRPR